MSDDEVVASGAAVLVHSAHSNTLSIALGSAIPHAFKLIKLLLGKAQITKQHLDELSCVWYGITKPVAKRVAKRVAKHVAKRGAKCVAKRVTKHFTKRVAKRVAKRVSICVD